LDPTGKRSRVTRSFPFIHVNRRASGENNRNIDLSAP
jgi:hypothetical protein